MNEPTTDQPTDHVVDHRPTSDQPPGTAGAVKLVTLEEAAAALDISVNAVRQRIKRHTVAAVKTDQGWLVDLVATNHRPTMSRPTNQPTDQRPHELAMPQPVDLAPLVDEISRLNQRNEELAAAAGMWQSRARSLEEQLQQLTATAGEAAGSPETNETADQDAGQDVREQDAQRGVWARLARWWKG